MKPFRIPRKTKKYLKGKMFFHIDNQQLMAFPLNSQEEYLLFKHGKLISMMEMYKKSERTNYIKEIFKNPCICISNDKLREIVDEIFIDSYRNTAYNKLINAKTNVNPGIYKYYNAFVNAYMITKSGEADLSNTCCMIVDDL